MSTGNVFAVNRNGYFGPVCDDHWTDTEADTVCRYISLSYILKRRPVIFYILDNLDSIEGLTTPIHTLEVFPLNSPWTVLTAPQQTTGSRIVPTLLLRIVVQMRELGSPATDTDYSSDCNQ